VAEKKIQKAVVPNEDLPSLSLDGKYYVRYRIVSEDKNRVSHWSPIYSVDPDYAFVPSGDLSVEKNSNHVLVIWNPVEIKKNNKLIKTAKEYDVWFRWHKSDAGDWKFFERVETNSLTLLAPTSYTIDGVDQATAPNRLDVEIYLAGTPIKRFDDPSSLLKVYSKANTTI
jgi:hypothetical protein